MFISIKWYYLIIVLLYVITWMFDRAIMMESICDNDHDNLMYTDGDNYVNF